MTVRVSLTPLSEASHNILKFFRGVLAVIAIMYLGCFGYVTTRRMLYQLSATQILDSTSEDHSISKIAPHPGDNAPGAGYCAPPGSVGRGE